MNAFLYIFARCLIGGLQCLPIKAVALLARAGGYLAWRLDRRHRTVAIDNLTHAFPDKSAAEIRALARENFQRIGENFACGIKSASLSDQAIRKVLTLDGAERMPPNPNHLWITAAGHFGNFELYARASQFVGQVRIATTYRGLGQPAVDRLLLHLRQQSGSLYFERRNEGAQLKEAMRAGHVMLGLLADQHAGDRGVRLPFFGRECSTSTAPAVFALRYKCPLLVTVCYRTGLGRWRLEIGAEIPTTAKGGPRSVEAISADVNRAFEAAIRRDPANWFWVDRRWKPASRIQLARAAAKKLASPDEPGESGPQAE